MDEKDKIIAELKQEIIQLREEIRLLKEDIARLKKDSNNSSKPPSSDIVKPKKTTRKVSRKKRKRGGQFGHRKFSRPAFAPEQVDEVIEYELKDKDALGLKPLDEWLVMQQIKLPEKMFQVIEHRARKYIDPVTGRIHIASLPEDVRKGGLLGGDVTAMVAFMKGGCHMSFSTIKQFFKEVMRLEVSRGMFNKATQKCLLRLSRLISNLPNACRMNRISESMRPAIKTTVINTGHGVFKSQSIRSFI